MDILSLIMTISMLLISIVLISVGKDMKNDNEDKGFIIGIGLACLMIGVPFGLMGVFLLG